MIYAFIGILLAALTYLDPVNIFGMKFGVVWKMTFVFLLLYSIIIFRRGKTNWTILFGYLSSFVIFIITIRDLGFFNSAIYSSKFLTIPLLLHAFSNFRITRDKKLKNYIQSIDIFLFSLVSSIIIFCFASWINIIPSLGTGYDLEIFGMEGEGFVGIFQNPHSASFTMCITLIFLSEKIARSNSKFTLAWATILFCLSSYFLIATYVRTGIFMLFAAAVLAAFKLKRAKHRLYVFSGISLSGLILLIAVQVSEPVKMRFAGENIYSEQNGSGSISSGRTDFWTAAISSWADSSFTEIMIGQGQVISMDKMETLTGVRVYAHNGYLEQLQNTGLIGLIALVAFHLALYRTAVTTNSNEKSISFALMAAFLVGNILQGERFFMFDIMLAIMLAKSRIQGRVGPHGSFQRLKFISDKPVKI